MSKTTNTNGLDIRFKINKKEYRLRSSAYDFILEEVKIGKSGKVEGEEVFDFVGNGSTLYTFLNYLPKEYHLRNSELNSLKELLDEQRLLIESLSDITSNITLECFIKPEERKSLFNKVQDLENEIERLKTDNRSLRKKKS